MFGFVVSAATNCGVILITSIDDSSKENPGAADRPTCGAALCRRSGVSDWTAVPAPQAATLIRRQPQQNLVVS
jgi:hypothetical protein